MNSKDGFIGSDDWPNVITGESLPDSEIIGP